MPTEGGAGMTRSEREKAKHIARTLGVELSRGLRVQGHHNTVESGCGSYDLVLNVEKGWVECQKCGATNLERVK